MTPEIKSYVTSNADDQDDTAADYEELFDQALLSLEAELDKSMR